MEFEEFLSHFKVAYRNGSKAQCLCPAHQDRQASLTISNDGNKTLIHCHAGCSTESILAAVGLKMADLFEEKQYISPSDRMRQYIEGKEKKKIEEIYHYTDTSGQYVFSRVRLEGKRFIYGVIADNKFKYGLGGKHRKNIPAVFCNNDLPGFRKAVQEGKTVYCVEGEKDVLTLASRGLPAITCGASGDWNRDCSSLFSGADLVILQDNDAPGAKLSSAIVKDVLPVANSVKVVVPTPDLEHGDISDFFEAGHSVDEMNDLIDKAEPLKNQPALSVDTVPVLKKDSAEITESEAISLSCKCAISLPLFRGDDDKPLSLLENYVEILRSDTYLKGRFSWNALSGRVELSGFFWNLDTHPIRDVDLYRIRLHISQAYKISNISAIEQAIAIVADSNKIHPIRDKLFSLRWDGKSRLSELFPKFLGAERSDYTTAVTKLLLFGAIQRVLNPGIKFDLCVILADTKQGTGKSSMCRYLALSDEWFTDSLGDLADNKRSYETLRGRWICELGEMLSTRKTKDVEAIKAFLSRTYDDYREPYGRFSEQYPRQCICIGTSNNPSFLPDDRSGNRRFIPLFCDGNKAELHPVENEIFTRSFIEQCYAEAMVVGREEGFPLTLDRRFTDELEALQEAATPEDTMIGVIQEWLDQNTDIDIVCSRMLFEKALGRDDPPRKYELQNISDIMNFSIKGWRKYAGRNGQSKDNKHRFKGYGLQRAWERVRACTQAVPRRDGFVPVPADDDGIFT